MTETKSPEAAAAPSEERLRNLTSLRRGFIVGAVALVVIVLMVTMSGSGGASHSLLLAVLWGLVTVLFLGGFIVGLIEQGVRREAGAALAKETEAPRAVRDADGVDTKEDAKKPEERPTPHRDPETPTEPHARDAVAAVARWGDKYKEGLFVRKGTLARTYELGEHYRASLVDATSSEGVVDYERVLAVFRTDDFADAGQEVKAEPIFLVTLEATRKDPVERRLAAFGETGTRSEVGPTDGLDADAFAKQALDVARDKLYISAEPKLLEVEKEEEEPGKEPPLLPKGNPLRWARGGLTTLGGAIPAFLLMAHNAQLRWGVPLGIVFVAIATWGVMDFVGAFDDADQHVASSTSLDALAMPLARAFVALVLFLGLIGIAAVGEGPPQWFWGLLVTLSFIGLMAAVFDVGVRLGVFAKDETGEVRPLLKREGFWLLVVGAFLYFPMMGSYALWDPWETHYGEVAREMLARDDWISTWWAQDGWFWSKPVLDFWIQAVFMATLGVHYKPDQMLVGTGTVPHYQPEWVVRAPVVLMALVAMYILYKGIAKAFGRRPALLGGLVLATMPDWYFLAHQTMTDMPFVAAMTAAMGLVLLGLYTPEGTTARAYEVKVSARTTWRLTGWHLVFGAILLSALPQILYLFSRNLELVLHGGGPHGFRLHWDEFRSGSGGGNCGLPHNEQCANQVAAAVPHSTGPNPETVWGMIVRTFGAFEPFVQAIVWIAVLAAVLYMNWGERRVRRLYYLAAWFFCAVSTLGKGPAGFLLPMLCTFAYVCTTKRWTEFLRFEIVGGLLVILAVALPWYVAMYVRHGSPFTDRLIFHDMFNRAFHHVHDTNEGDDTSFRFYIWQLGYALFPWTGLAPLGLLYWMRKPDFVGGAGGREARTGLGGDASVLLAWWFIFSFALFSFMGTKFHHYIFPAVPAVAMLVGITLHEILGSRPLLGKGGLVVYLAGLTGGTALATMGVSRFLPGSLWGTKSAKGDLAEPSSVAAIALIVLGLAMVAFFVRHFREKGAEAPSDGESEAARFHEPLMVGGAAVAGALTLLLVGRDMVLKPEGADQPGAIRLLHLFTYNYRRPWPDSLDFSAILLGFTVVAAALSFALGVRALRRHMVVAFFCFAGVWAIWGLDVYMIQTAPHWGQHEVIEAYYAHRANPEEMLVAYQMNWKGENFYTGNRIPAFVSTGSDFTNWLKKKKEDGEKVMFFITEHSRIGGLKSEVQAKKYDEITDKTLCNKFVLVRAEL